MSTVQSIQKHGCTKDEYKCSHQNVLPTISKNLSGKTECDCADTIQTLLYQMNNLALQVNALNTIINNIQDTLYLPAFDEDPIFLPDTTF